LSEITQPAAGVVHLSAAGQADALAALMAQSHAAVTAATLELAAAVSAPRRALTLLTAFAMAASA